MILKQRLHSPFSVRTADFPSTTACRGGRSQLEGSSPLGNQSRPAVSPGSLRHTRRGMANRCPQPGPSRNEPSGPQGPDGSGAGLRGSPPLPRLVACQCGAKSWKMTPPSVRGHPALPTPKPCGERGLAGRCLMSTGSVGKGPPGLKLILSMTHSGTISPLQSAAWRACRSGISPTTGLRLGWSKAASNQTTPEGQAARRLRVCSGALRPV